MFIGGGVTYRKTGLNGLLFIHRRPPPASTGYCSSTIDLLQPPRAPVHPASTVRYSTGYCSIIPLHGLLFNHPSTGYFSSTPPPPTVHLALHGVLFIQPQPARSVRVLFIQRQRHGVLFIHPHYSLFIQTPCNTHCSSRGIIDRLQLAAVAKESLDRSGSVTRSLQCNRLGSVRRCLAQVQLEPNASHTRAYVYERNVHRSAPDHPP